MYASVRTSKNLSSCTAFIPVRLELSGFIIWFSSATCERVALPPVTSLRSHETERIMHCRLIETDRTHTDSSFVRLTVLYFIFFKGINRARNSCVANPKVQCYVSNVKGPVTSNCSFVFNNPRRVVSELPQSSECSTVPCAPNTDICLE